VLSHPRQIAYVLAAAGLAAACASSTDVTPVARDAVRVVALPYLTQMPFHIASAEGYFEEQGLEVEFLKLGRNQEVMTTLAHGDVDAMAGMLTLNELSLMAAGAHVRAVAAFATPPPPDLGCTQSAFLIRREYIESGAAADPARLRDMKFDVHPLIPLAYAFDLLLNSVGLTIDDVQLVDLPSPAAVEAMRSGLVDATVDSEPFVSIHVSAGQAVVWKPVHDLTPEFVQSVMLFGPTLLEDRPEVGQRFATAVLKAIRQYRLGKTPRNLEIVQRESGLTSAQVADACWPTQSESGRIDPAAFGGYQTWLVARGLLPRVLADDEVVDGRFIEFANAELSR